MEAEEQGFSPTIKPKEKWNGEKPKKNPAESEPLMNHEHSNTQQGKLRNKRN